MRIIGVFVLLLAIATAGIGFAMGYKAGDSAARSERAERINQCYEYSRSTNELYGCYSAN